MIRGSAARGVRVIVSASEVLLRVPPGETILLRTTFMMRLGAHRGSPGIHGEAPPKYPRVADAAFDSGRARTMLS